MLASSTRNPRWRILQPSAIAIGALTLAACGSGEDSTTATADAGPGGAASGSGGTSASASGGSQASSNTGGGGGPSGNSGGAMPSNDAGASYGGSNDPGTTPSADASTSDPGCSSSLAAQPCAGDRTCRFVEDCQSGVCACIDRFWSCSRRNTCSSTCGVPQESACGDACAAPARGCLCSPGGGPNYVGCDCTNGIWECRR